MKSLKKFENKQIASKNVKGGDVAGTQTSRRVGDWIERDLAIKTNKLYSGTIRHDYKVRSNGVGWSPNPIGG